MYAHVDVSGYTLNDELGARYYAALEEWNTSSGGKAYFNDVPISSSKCDLVVPYETPSGVYEDYESYWYLGDNYLGGAFLKNSYGQWNKNYQPGILGSNGYVVENVYDGPFDSGLIVYAIIYFSPRMENYVASGQSTTNVIDYTLRHELGHVLGLGHPPNSEFKITIMYAAFGDFLTKYVEDYDRAVLAQFY